MSRLRIFISHSSGEDPSLVLALKSALESGPEPYEILLDKHEIQTGDQWRRTVHAMLAGCHAAVILFSHRALESDWVLKEATILTWRRALSEDFQLLPICLPDVDPGALDEGRFAPLHLRELQYAKAATADEIAALVRGRLRPPASRDTPLDRLGLEISASLGALADAILESACELHFGPVDWSARPDRKQVFCELLSRRILEVGQKNLVAAVEILASLGRSLSPDSARRIIDLLAPFWVEPDAAGKIPPVASRLLPYRDVALNGRRLYDFTAEMYLHRAYPLTTLPKLVPVEGAYPDGVVEYIAHRIREGVRTKFPRVRSQPDAEVDRFIAALKAPLFVLLPQLPPDEEMLRELRDRYPKITYIIATDDRLPPEDELYAGVLALSPELSVEDEEAAFWDYAEADGHVGDQR